MEDRGPEKTGLGVEEVVSRKGGSTQSSPAQSYNSSGSPEDPVVLLGDNGSSSSEAAVDDGHLCAESVVADEGLLDSPNSAIDLTLEDTKSHSVRLYNQQPNHLSTDRSTRGETGAGGTIE
ncbi:uncharacterized protein PAC_18695 [Phialocephala subalpina]|uniref:Uncharacterized protein n=1 Tax=Phialocephala subalpina TaxID=576137 RepID=A0A1L7XUV5_9HELO|nr:uncharacterized protein PAC_18695 [Phialocephala subalpina]